jgi:predicted RNA binding protein YcfA (HicA-like mRNA interferase family)
VPQIGPIKRRDLIRYLKRLGFRGPFKSGGPHNQYMERGQLKLRLPNQHEGDISVGLLKRILREGQITDEEWEALT